MTALWAPLSFVESLSQLEEVLPGLRGHRAFNWAEAELELMADRGKRTFEATDFAIQSRIPAAIEDGRLERRAGLQISADDSQVMICGNPAMTAAWVVPMPP